MVDTLQPYEKALKDVKTDLPKIIRNILIKRKDEVLYLLQDLQLGKGLDSKGELIGTYSVFTEKKAQKEYTRKKKIAGNPYNFQWTGGTFDKMYMHFETEETYTLFSKDYKATMLEDIYGDIFTLTEKNNKEVNEKIILPEMYEEIIRRLFI